MFSYFTTIKGHIISLEYKKTDSIEVIKKKISKVLKLNWEDLCIIFCGRECKNTDIADNFKFWLKGKPYIIYRIRE